MQQAKVKIFLNTFSYGGNGGISSQHPDVTKFLVQTRLKAEKDPRISEIIYQDFSDTPITMSRNRAVCEARRRKADILMMVDSDMSPDCHVGQDALARPFFDSSFDFLYNRLMQGKQTCVVAPYCGCSPHQAVFIFKWYSSSSNKPRDATNFHLDMYSREEAATMSGFQNCAAGPTGLWMSTVDPLFSWFEPMTPTDKYRTLEEFKAGNIEAVECLRRLGQKPWFYYDFDILGEEKQSTEDVVATRDMVLSALLHGHDNPLFCNWDAWAGHWKPELVKKPAPLHPEHVTEKFVDAARRNSVEERVVQADFPIPTGVRYVDELADPGAMLEVLKNTNMTSDERLALSRAARDAAGYAIEVGSWIGDSTTDICRAMQSKISNYEVHCVDHWRGSPNDPTGAIARKIGEVCDESELLFECFLENTKEWSDHIHVHRVSSSDAVSDFRDECADFILIDADHDYEGAITDLRNYWPKLKPGGTLALHDFGAPAFPGVADAWEDFRKENDIGLHRTVGTLLIAKKFAATNNGKRPELSLSASDT